MILIFRVCEVLGGTHTKLDDPMILDMGYVLFIWEHMKIMKFKYEIWADKGTLKID